MGRRGRDVVLGTSEARKSLPELVRKAVAPGRASSSVRKRAVEIKPRGESRSASLVPTIDLEAAEDESAKLHEELENAGIALFLLDRLNRTSGDRLSEAEFLEGIGMADFARELSDSR